MQILEVGNDPKLQKQFLNLPVKLYEGNQYWIRPLDNDVEDIFDRNKNKYFKHGDCIRWIATDENGQTVGRVAAFVNNNTANKGNDQPTGGMGFFESIEDQSVAFALFDQCKNWLIAQGMEAMDGPINFGERDRFWGVLSNGFDKEPTYGMGYHWPYYKDFFVAYGFQTYFEQFTYWMLTAEEGVRKTAHPAFINRAERIYNTPGYEFRHIKKNNLSQVAEEFKDIYNKAWASNQGTDDISSEKAQALMQKLKPVIDEELIWFGYHEGKPIAFFIMLPELNQVFKHVNGKMDLIGKLKFLYHKLLKTNRKAFGVVFGVVPEYQSKGVECAIGLAFSRIVWQPNSQYKELEMNWVGDFNPKMIKFVQLLGAVPHKTHITFRYLFDRTKEFKRHKVM
jgi:hypothetical protein